MSTKPSTNSVTVPGIRRRWLPGMAMIAAVSLMSRRAFADTAPADPIATIQHFNAALLTTMKMAEQTTFSLRFQALAPAVDQAFDLRAVLAVSVGAGWVSLAPDQQSRLLDAFRRYSVASYVANFDSYAGQSFIVSPDVRSLGADRVVVQSRILPISGDATELDYLMQQTAAGWKVADVLAAGSISRVAVQRSDFRRVLVNGGSDALLASLQRKTTDLSGGASG
jgi:phospholipid transport system substrate-binding protein